MQQADKQQQQQPGAIFVLKNDQQVVDVVARAKQHTSCQAKGIAMLVSQLTATIQLLTYIFGDRTDIYQFRSPGFRAFSRVCRDRVVFELLSMKQNLAAFSDGLDRVFVKYSKQQITDGKNPITKTVEAKLSKTEFFTGTSGTLAHISERINEMMVRRKGSSLEPAYAKLRIYNYNVSRLIAFVEYAEKVDSPQGGIAGAWAMIKGFEQEFDFKTQR